MKGSRIPGQLLLDNHSWKQLLEERRQRSDGENPPVRWHELIDEMSRDLTGQPAAPWTLRHTFSRHSQLIACLPSLPVVFTAFMKRGNLIYLCWGVPPYQGLKRMVFRLILTRATHLLVNDDVTRMQIRAATGRSANLIPYVVDTGYFSYCPINGRKSFLFCLGSNDRDHDALIGLAEAGHDVVWLVNDPSLAAIYGNRHPRLQLCSRIPYASLRQLYQTCAAVVLPLARNVHAAGQTTAIEALASGCPLVISRCRAASLVEAMPSVCVVENNDPATWRRALQLLSERIAKEPGLTEIAALKVRKRNSRESVSRAFAECMADVPYKKLSNNCET
jgi:glycosyltransferase involved in cell wall biosynthesis